MWVFDCDGVLLDSNEVKTEAFRQVTSRYGDEVATDVVEHHLMNGGVSRHAKFERMFDAVLRRPARSGEMDRLLADFAEISFHGLLNAIADPNVVTLLRHLESIGEIAVVVSGGLQSEVRDVLEQRGFAGCFADILGSPTPKFDHVANLLERASTIEGHVLVGDSREDLRIALELGFTPVFVSHWTEFADWPSFVEENDDVLVVDDLGALLAHVRG